MSATITDFRLRFPEFKATGDAIVNAMLLDASAQVDYSVFSPAKADLAVLYLAAHSLALSPMGNAAKLVAKDGKTTTYWTRYLDLCAMVASGGRVL